MRTNQRCESWFSLRILFIFVFLLMLVMPLPAAAQTAAELKVTTDVIGGYTYENGMLTFLKSGAYKIEMNGVEKTSHQIQINKNGVYDDTKKIELTLSGLTLEGNRDAIIKLFGSADPDIEVRNKK